MKTKNEKKSEISSPILSAKFFSCVFTRGIELICKPFD